MYLSYCFTYNVKEILILIYIQLNIKTNINSYYYNVLI